MMSLAWPLFRITEQAALAAWPQTGCVMGWLLPRCDRH